MKRIQYLITCFLSLTLVLVSQYTYSQDYDYSNDEEDYSENNYDDYSNYDNPDSSADTSSSGDYGSYDDYDDGGSSSYGNDAGYDEIKQEPVFVRKAYVRFKPPYDSIREVVSYSGTVDVKDKEDYEIEVDTIYARAKNWMETEFGRKQLKKMTKVDGLNEKASETEYKIVLRGTFPCMVEPNEFTTTQDGDIQFKMELRFREGRYRYRINNLVHVGDILAGEKKPEHTYFEYFMKSEDDIRGNDVILLAADKKINQMIDELRRSCQTNPLEEEDDW